MTALTLLHSAGCFGAGIAARPNNKPASCPRFVMTGCRKRGGSLPECERKSRALASSRRCKMPPDRDYSPGVFFCLYRANRSALDPCRAQEKLARACAKLDLTPCFLDCKQITEAKGG